MLFNRKRPISVHTVGDPVLKKVAAPILEINQGTRQLAEEMVLAMEAFNGIGLAGPQYGVSLRIIVIDVPVESQNTHTPGEELLLPQMPLALVNPEIMSFSDQTDEREEGCLSVPDLYAPVVRPSRIVLRATKLDGEVIECECGGLLSRCLQHEIDHLDGKLFIDRLSEKTKQQVMNDVNSLKRCGMRSNYVRTKMI